MEHSRQFKGDEANYCTIELVSGRLLQVDYSPDDMVERLARASNQALTWLEVEVMRPDSSDALYRNPARVAPESVVAIYPLDTVPRRDPVFRRGT